MSKSLDNKIKLNETDGIAVVTSAAYGAVGDGVADDTAAIQAAIDTGTCYIPAGNYKITGTLYLDNDTFVIGSGTGTQLTSTHNGAIFAGKDVTPASGTNVRKYYGGIKDIRLYGPGVASTSSIGIDERGLTGFVWDNVLIQNIHTGIRRGGGYATYYNKGYKLDISTCVYGIYSTSLGNSNAIISGRVNECTVGTYDNDNSQNVYFDVAVEQFQTIAHQVTSPAALAHSFLYSRIENGGALLGTGTAFSIDATAQDTVIMCNYARGYGTLITEVSAGVPTGVRTLAQLSEYASFFSGTAIKKHLSVSVTKSIASLATLTARDESFTVPGVLAGDSVSVTLPSALTPTLIVGPAKVGGTDLVYLPLYNPTGGSIAPASMTYKFDVWRH